MSCPETKIIQKLIPFLEAKERAYVKQGLIPTINLLIEDLKEYEEVR